MANQAKAITLTFVNFQLSYEHNGVVNQVPLRFQAANLTDASAREIELALLIETGEVKAEAISIDISNVHPNMPAQASSGKSKEELMAELMAKRGVSATPAPTQDAVPAVDDDSDIPF